MAAVSSFYDWAIIAGGYEHDVSPVQMRPDPALARVPGRHQPFMGGPAASSRFAGWYR